MEFIDLKRQYAAYKNEINIAIQEILDKSRFILGEPVSALEEKLSRYVGQKGAVGVASGTDGLLLSLMALDVRAGDIVITTPFTFIATAEVISFLGARPVFSDIDPETFNLDVEKLAQTIEDLKSKNKKPKGIIAVSLYGQCPDMDELLSLAEEHELFLLEDACQSFGAKYKGHLSCGLTSISVTSFFPAKPLGCYGDGGMVFANNDAILERIKSLRNHGQKKRYLHEEIGLNSRLDAMQAAILLVKFKYFEEEVENRNKAACTYSELIKGTGLPITVPVVKPDRTSVFAQYTIRIPGGKRDRVRDILTNKGIPTAIHYPVPLHLQPCFAGLGYKEGAFPEAERASKEVLSLPMHPFISKEEQQQIVEAIKEALT